MSETITSMRETHLIGPRTREWIVSREQCRFFQSHQLALAGTSEIRPPYRMVRLHPLFSHVVVCLEGRGRAWVEGRWKILEPDHAYLAPPEKFHAFEPEGKARWKIAWVFYHRDGKEDLLAGLEDPLIKPVDAKPVAVLVEGIYREIHGAANPALLHHLTEALHLHILRTRSDEVFDRRIAKMTSLLEASLSYPWTVREMARRLHLSEEHLRRLCWKTLQRSPMEHVTHLRMQRACASLHARGTKLHAIAESVGYANEFSFSAAFKRSIGVSPSLYRMNAAFRTEAEYPARQSNS